jgi:hypothetical protein
MSSISALQASRSDQVPSGPFFAQQTAINRFVEHVQPELRK